MWYIYTTAAAAKSKGGPGRKQSHTLETICGSQKTTGAWEQQGKTKRREERIYYLIIHLTDISWTSTTCRDLARMGKMMDILDSSYVVF